MPWQMPSLLREKVDRARHLLQHSTEHRGSREMAAFVEGTELLERVHAIFLNADGTPRWGVTREEKDAGVLACARMLYLSPIVADISVNCQVAVRNAASEPGIIGRLIGTLSGATASQISPWVPIKLAARAFMAQIHHAGGDAYLLAAQAEHYLQSTPGAMAALDATLPALARQHGVQLTATQLLQACSRAQVRMFLKYKQSLSSDSSFLDRLCSTVPSHAACQPGTSTDRRGGALVVDTYQKAQALRVCDQQQPAYLVLVASLEMDYLDTTSASSSFRNALQLAATRNDHHCAAEAAIRLGFLVTSAGSHQQRFSRREVEGLLDTARRHLALCRAWLPSAVRDFLPSQLSVLSNRLAAIAARLPHSDMLPATCSDSQPGTTTSSAECAVYAGAVHVDFGSHRCANCKQARLHLRKCSACKAVSYCSRECQQEHWKTGGHKRECKRLAAERAAAAGGA